MDVPISHDKPNRGNTVIPVRQSSFAWCFDEHPADQVDAADIYLLDLQEAHDAWTSYIDSANCRGIFDVSENSWVSTSEKNWIGNWRPQHGDKEIDHQFCERIAEISGWNRERPLLLIESKRVAVSLRFNSFVRFWPDLLMRINEAPILLSRESDSLCAFCFAPTGHVQHMHRRDPPRELRMA
ncbi:DUF2947 family protein [Tahibacter amnicola]|uniref:DUF2947 family protein n=1 Tax=Tahibacter amnicola TaxID=2976241 RepID=A0ABY6BL07_9GAMM|nr:DUF2947 family protein [Tahibacter amnicola]UXI70306.1 DUF2947 family protein [Tahibacter amnicola]